MKKNANPKRLTLLSRCKAWTLVRTSYGDFAVLRSLAAWATSMGFPADPKAQPVEVEKQVVRAIEKIGTPENLGAIDNWLQALKTDSNALPPGGLQEILIA